MRTHRLRTHRLSIPTAVIQEPVRLPARVTPSEIAQPIRATPPGWKTPPAGLIYELVIRPATGEVIGWRYAADPDLGYKVIAGRKSWRDRCEECRRWPRAVVLRIVRSGGR